MNNTKGYTVIDSTRHHQSFLHPRYISGLVRHHGDRHTHCVNDMKQSEHLIQKLMSLFVRSTWLYVFSSSDLGLLGPEPTSGTHLACQFQPHVWYVQQKKLRAINLKSQINIKII